MSPWGTINSSGFPIRRIITKFMSSNIILRSMAKVAIKYENIVPHGEIFCTSILKVQQHWGRCWRNRKNKGRFSKNLPRFSKNVGDFLGCVVEIVAWSSNSFLAFQCEKISIVKKSFKPPPHACARARTTEILHILLSQPSPFFV